MTASPVQVVCLNIGGNLGFPLVSIVQEFLFVVQQLLVGLGRELKVGSLHNGIDRASFLTKAAINTFGHVNVVSEKSKAVSVIHVSSLALTHRVVLRAPSALSSASMVIA